MTVRRRQVIALLLAVATLLFVWGALAERATVRTGATGTKSETPTPAPAGGDAHQHVEGGSETTVPTEASVEA